MLKKIASLVLVLSVVLPMAVSAEDNGGRDFMRMPCTGGALYNSMTGEKCPTNTGTTPTTSVTYNPTCASAAVVAQENSMQTIRDTFETSMKTAAATRRDALAAAYLKTDATERATAIKAAMDAFRTAQQAAEKTRKDAEKTLMDSFKTTMQGCGVTGKEMMKMGEGMGMGEKMMSEMGKMMNNKDGKKAQGKKPMKPVMMDDSSESNDR